MQVLEAVASTSVSQVLCFLPKFKDMQVTLAKKFGLIPERYCSLKVHRKVSVQFFFLSVSSFSLIS